jgi:hypothetical protein
MLPAVWSGRLLVTVRGGKPVYLDLKDKHWLEDKVKGFIGKDKERLIGTTDSPLTDGARKEAVKGFVTFLGTLNIKERPKASDDQCICTLCGRIAACNATHWLAHITTSCIPDHPDMANAAVKLDSGKSAASLVGAKKRKCISDMASEHKEAASASRKQPLSVSAAVGSVTVTRALLPSVGPSVSPTPAEFGSMKTYLDRKLSDAEVRAVDELLARFCYAENIPFRALESRFLREALSKLSSSWTTKSRLTQWNVRNSFLSDESERIDARVQEKIKSACACTLLSDGWSGLQKEHELNILIATPVPLFVSNIFTKAGRVDGVYQVCAARAGTARAWLAY